MEREALGLNQSDMGALGGVGKQAQLNYELDRRSPSANYLQRLVTAGVDTQFLLTGTRLEMSKPSQKKENEGNGSAATVLTAREEMSIFTPGQLAMLAANPARHLLGEALVAVEVELEKMGVVLPAARRAQLAWALFEMSLPLQKLNKAALAPLMSVA
jgi:transcriptional regulator with XRE-family HTH domain